MLEVLPEEMIALWNEDDSGKICEFMIAKYSDQPMWAHKMLSSRGACCAGWMSGDALETPLGLFAEISVTYGFASDEIVRLVIREFSRVKGQSWANEIMSRAGIGDGE
jgi:hypothetical protein